MKRKVILMLIIGASIGFVFRTEPRTVMVHLLQEDPLVNFVYAIGSGTEYECQPDPSLLTYRTINGSRGVTIAFDDTLVNILYIKESGENVPFIGFNLKNTATLRLGGLNAILIRRDEVPVYVNLEDLEL